MYLYVQLCTSKCSCRNICKIYPIRKSLNQLTRLRSDCRHRRSGTSFLVAPPTLHCIPSQSLAPGRSFERRVLPAHKSSSLLCDRRNILPPRSLMSCALFRACHCPCLRLCAIAEISRPLAGEALRSPSRASRGCTRTAADAPVRIRLTDFWSAEDSVRIPGRGIAGQPCEQNGEFHSSVHSQNHASLPALTPQSLYSTLHAESLVIHATVQFVSSP